jgi:hypothetical protein
MQWAEITRYAERRIRLVCLAYMTAASENRLCEWCGYEKDSVDTNGVCKDCSPKFNEWQREREALLDRYRCRPNEPSVLPMPWTEAVARVAEELGHPIDVAPDGACEAATWWFVPFSWIGCSGFFVDKTDGFVLQLGTRLRRAPAASA